MLSVPRLTFHTSPKVKWSKVKVTGQLWVAVQVTTCKGEGRGGAGRAPGVRTLARMTRYIRADPKSFYRATRSVSAVFAVPGVCPSSYCIQTAEDVKHLYRLGSPIFDPERRHPIAREPLQRRMGNKYIGVGNFVIFD